MKISPAAHQKKKATLAAMQQERLQWWRHWRDIADYFLPRRYVWLLSQTERMNKMTRNPLILDATGTQALKTLASGFMNGTTSPSRPWFKLRIPGYSLEDDRAAAIWLDEVTRRILLIMAESNFYNAMATMYLDLGGFGTAAVLIYEDFDNVINCQNCSLGEFYIQQDARGIVNTFARQFTLTVKQVVMEYELENVSMQVRMKWEAGGANLMAPVTITHLVQPNIDQVDEPKKGSWSHYECYWDSDAPDGELLRERGFNEMPGIFPRWELSGNDSYGSSPAMDALGDVIQLQHETKKKGQGLDKLIDPPLIADIQLQHKPMALLPRGVTYVAGANNIGAKPIYTIQLPLDQLSADIADVQNRIKEFFYNDLFKMISQLDTVRSATEIDARREEKLVLLGPVYERLNNEAYDLAVKRIFGIALRAGLLPDPPASIEDKDIEIQYTSVLTAAQTAVATIPMERWIGFVGNIAAVKPQVLNIPDWEEVVRKYGRDLGVETSNMVSREQSEEATNAQNSAAQAQETANTGSVLVDSAKTLSETQVSGGANALSRLINPYNAG